jgi:hypothetical protein
MQAKTIRIHDFFWQQYSPLPVPLREFLSLEKLMSYTGGVLRLALAGVLLCSIFCHAADDAVCPQCMGLGHVPKTLTPYVRAEGESARPDVSVRFRQCPKCKAGLDDKELLKEEAERKSFDLKKSMEEKTGLKFNAVETHTLTICGQISVPELKEIGNSLEKLAIYLQTTTQSTLLTPARPDVDAHYFLKDKASYGKMLVAFGQQPGSLGFEAGGGCFGHEGLTWPKNPVPRPNTAVFSAAGMMLRIATGEKAPAWLREGFSASCEREILGKNCNYSIAYESNDVKFENDWSAEVKKLARQKKLRPWDEIFPIEMIGLGPVQYLTCYAMARFLIKQDPIAFNRAVALIRDGEPSPTAIEKAYGKKIKDLQTAWQTWCLTMK